MPIVDNANIYTYSSITMIKIYQTDIFVGFFRANHAFLLKFKNNFIYSILYTNRIFRETSIAWTNEVFRLGRQSFKNT